MPRTIGTKPIVFADYVHQIDSCLCAFFLTRSASYERSVCGCLAKMEQYLSQIYLYKGDPIAWEMWKDYKQLVLSALKEKDMNSAGYFCETGFDGLHLGQHIDSRASIQLVHFLEENPEERARFGFR